ncbi:hypothetical protein [Oharaeibacter diazotrophicus]|uniref:Secreted protein n=1 Tax=Oharaeibacter diazotrophicus TaxID=1920512 RepID=A0A4R6RF31_9HYPH|nr:hypothetical protein [Oharaeibacter diazotrophicus]TDP84387.1 hypothetical protein EDD54_2994 [Oharaeibacter diazotrophicus]BBE73425.1 hypothetical protein OHA_1_03036 [Pleomorphomonas sp. SM30]GLS75216.1 hypothetical protein GCM10007904_05510 [Oharaeibacter diazotrophicus]
MTIARATFAAALATLALGAAVPHASATPIVVGSDYAERLQGSCYGKDQCAINFSAIPAGKTLVVTDVSCSGQMPYDQNLVLLQLLSLKTNGTYAFLNSIIEFGPQVVNGLYNTFQAHQQMRYVVYAGEKPVVANLKNKFVGENYYSCSIVGVLK